MVSRADQALGVKQGSKTGLEIWRHTKSGTPQRAEQNRTNPVASEQTRLLSLFCVPIGVDRREAIPLFGQVLERKDGRHRADRDARSAIDAFRGMDIQLCFALEIGFILARMYAVYRTDIHAGGVFCADSRLGDHVSH